MNAVGWFEIPALDLERAFNFYSSILPGKIKKGTLGTENLLLFDVSFNDGSAVGGSIVRREIMRPSVEGSMVYLNAFGPLSEVVTRIEPAGGTVYIPKIDLGKFGFTAIFVDSEGNKMGLISSEA